MGEETRRRVSRKEAAEILGVAAESVTHWVKQGYLKTVSDAPRQIDLGSVEVLKSRLADGSVAKLRARANKSFAEDFFVPFVPTDDKEAQQNLMSLVEFVGSRCLPRAAALFALVLNVVRKSEGQGEQVQVGDREQVQVGDREREQVGDRERVQEELRSCEFGEVLDLELMALRTCLGSGSWLEGVPTEGAPREGVPRERAPREGAPRERAPRERAPREGALTERAGWNMEDSVWQALLGWNLPQIPDILGVVYQILTRENVKVRQGAYFTPQPVVEAIAADHWREGRFVFDPCCGTGKFLLAFAARGANPEELWGMDIDPVAVLLTRINLLLFYRRPFQPRIFCGDSLRGEGWETPLRGMVGRFDVVATNPPWGAVIRGSMCDFPGSIDVGFSDVSKLQSQKESFALFLVLGLACLRPGGSLSYLLPEAFLMVKRHEEIRRFLLENCMLKNIECLGNIFHKVSSKAVRLDVEKGRTNREKGLASMAGRFSRNEGAIYDVWTSAEDGLILDKMEQGSFRTLAGHAQWALGVVTGDNGRFLRDAKGDDGEGILCGGDVGAFVLREPSRFLVFRPDCLQQVAPVALYRSPKLVYRFIGTRPVVAYDAVGRLTLNSANSVIVNLEGFPVRAVEALWNTKLYAFFFFHRFHAVKVLRAHLERLPLPCWPSYLLNVLAELAEELGATELSLTKRKALTAELEYEVMRGFGLSVREQERVFACVDGI